RQNRGHAVAAPHHNLGSFDPGAIASGRARDRGLHQTTTDIPEQGEAGGVIGVEYRAVARGLVLEDGALEADVLVPAELIEVVRRDVRDRGDAGRTVNVLKLRVADLEDDGRVRGHLAEALQE